MGQRILGGRYLLKDKIGTGGMATVYRAQDKVLDRSVAVKIMLPQYASDATFAARFKQEARAAAGLQSPYIVGVYDWGKDGDTYYIVMEYLRGTDLKSGIRAHGALDSKKVAQIGSQICSALAVAHKHEIVHRDIKPQNIMVQPDGNIKVMDFGIARAKNSHLTQDNNVLGTAHYVSPEQTRGQELGPTSDLYSLGVVMYECATGSVPFDGDDAISVALRQVNELPVAPRQVNPAVDADLERIILRCMEKNPADRFQSAEELRAALNSYLAGRTVDIPEPTHVLGVAPIGATTETDLLGNQTRTMVSPVRDAAAGPSATEQASSGPYERKPRRRGKIIAGIIAAIVLIAAITIFATNLFGQTQQVEVPNVLDMSQEEAIKKIEDSGFKVHQPISSQFDNDYEEGKVCDQTPKGAQSRAKGSEISITISKGAKPDETVQVPNIVGKDKDEASRLLTDQGLVPNPTEESNDAPIGQVFQQIQAAGTSVKKGSAIDYKVSTGPEQVTVPNLIGLTQQQAEAKLKSLNLQGSASKDTSNTTKGQVFKQDPASGSSVDIGSTVSYTISTGPAEPSTVLVPDLSGMTEQQASDALKSKGFGMNTTFEYDSTVKRGYVISFNPKLNQKSGTTITVVISRGPKPDPNPQPSTDPDKKPVQSSGN
ncbi:serine/threonine protein kinase [Coriobacterium glomerans PW2]|uniref:non-specific serine/threonine protein kinase n=1 Tax=Coriobacterium glomerans (strain ATCC 49209 / DSM 20642 / JCM 10262 / PW2) TaxID=700015 RepID=F2N980_CORGP|nr:Stk1 family PASTA domain-containing Ser/Thr kinase [Coriobacterium glomerans]AEB07756.1 serine/threonine protein kinase [Coriobacterium glomerans PW2]